MHIDLRAGHRFALATLALFAALTPASAQHKPLDAREQQLVNAAIDAGVGFLKRSQNLEGGWPRKDNSHVAGYTALPALTLLECGVPADDPAVKKAALVIRKMGPRLDATYEIALAILFLDRLGDRRDRALIQQLAARLIAGQTITGGWGYKCPLITRAEQTTLLTALRKLDPEVPALIARRPVDRPLQGIAQRPADRPMQGIGPGMVGGLGGFPAWAGSRGLDQGVTKGESPTGSQGSTRGESASPGERGSTIGLPDQQPDDRPAEERSLMPLRLAGRRWNGCIHEVEGTDRPPRPDRPDRPDKPVVRPKVIDVVPARMRNLPVFVEGQVVLADPEKRAAEPVLATTDNSNTQFAILALWAASRHDVPMTRTMRLVVRRFQTSQNADGGWGYHYRFGGGAPEGPAMTCVGLLGLAVGHALMEQPAALDKVDPAILKGFVALTKHVGVAVEGGQVPKMANLYLLWSIERVAVLYDLPTIGDKDWYRWAAQVLVTHQQEGGCWTDGGYHGAHPVLDTSLALLVLKRANLARDLADRLVIDANKLDRAIAIGVAPPKKEEEPALKGSKVQPTSPPANNSPPTTVTPSSDPKPESPAVPTTATASSAQASRGRPWWLFVVLALGLVTLGGGITCLVVHLRRRGAEEPEEDKRPRRRARRKE